MHQDQVHQITGFIRSQSKQGIALFHQPHSSQAELESCCSCLADVSYVKLLDRSSWKWVISLLNILKAICKLATSHTQNQGFVYPFIINIVIHITRSMNKGVKVSIASLLSCLVFWSPANFVLAVTLKPDVAVSSRPQTFHKPNPCIWYHRLSLLFYLHRFPPQCRKVRSIYNQRL